MVTNYTLLWRFSFLKCRKTRTKLSKSFKSLPHIYLYTTPKTKLKGKQSLKWKTFKSCLWLLKAIWSLQEFSKLLRDFLNFVLVCKGISIRYDNDKKKVFFSTVVNWGPFMNNLSKKVFKQLSINDKGYRFLKKLFQKTKFFMKLCPIRTNFETTISKSVNHSTKFVYWWQEPFKMGIHTTKCRFRINTCYKF